MSAPKKKFNLRPVIPKTGIIFSKKPEFTEIACKPKLLPLKSINLMKLEEMEKEIMRQNIELNKEEAMDENPGI